MAITVADDSVLLDGGLRLKFLRDAEYDAAPPLVAFNGDDQTLLQCTPEGRLKVDTSVTIDTVDIGDVNTLLKVGGVNQYWGGVLNPDLTTYAGYVQDQRMTFSGSGLLVDVQTITEDDDNAIGDGQTLPVTLNLMYGHWDGAWQRLTTDGSNRLAVAVQDSVLPDGAATEATLSTMLTLTGFEARINTLGQKTMALSTPVVLASDQSAIPAAQSGVWNVRMQDGAGTPLTSTLVNTRQAIDVHQADTSFVVSGLTAVGAAPALNPLSVSGVDAGGLKRHLLTDVGGRLVMAGEVTSGAPVYVSGTARALSLDLSGNLRVTPSSVGATSPGTVGAGESGNNRAYQTTFEITLGLGGTEKNAILLRNPTGSGKRAYIRNITFGNTTGASKSIILRVYKNPTLATAAVTFTDPGDIVTLVAHGYVNGDLVSFATIVATTGISINTNYYVVGAAANTFQVSLTSGGPAIALTTNGTGTIYRAGVALVPTSMNIGGAATGSVIVPTTVPLTTSTGTKLSVAAQTNEQATLDYDWGLLLNGGNSLLVTGTGTANNVPMVVNIIWSDAT